METFAEIYGRAAARRGGEEQLEALLPKAKSRPQLAATKDDRYLAEMVKCIFRSGFVWRVVEAKWSGFEEVFCGFDPQKVAALDQRDLGRISQDTRIIRNAKKVESVRDNATFVLDTGADHGSFGRFVAGWPSEDIVGLWLHLRKEGQRLGGDTGPMFLRGVGKDTFLLTRDIVGYLIEQGVVAKKPSGKKDLEAVQEAFNTWASESKRSLCQISRTISMSWGEVH